MRRKEVAKEMEEVKVIKRKRGGERPSGEEKLEEGWGRVFSSLCCLRLQAQQPAAAAGEAGGAGEDPEGGAVEDEFGEGAAQEQRRRVLQAARREGLVRRRRQGVYQQAAIKHGFNTLVLLRQG